MPIKIGPYAAKLSLHPIDPKPGLLAGGPSPTYLRDDLRARLASGAIAYELRLQFYENDESTPIEDMTDPWRTPYVPVGRVVIPTQDLGSGASQQLAADIEENPFSPWNTPAHRPLGEIGRARKEVYARSAQQRGACPFAFK